MTISIEILPQVRGTYEECKLLAPLTTLKIGGPADVFFTPADVDDLQNFMKNIDKNTLITILGEGSNALILDGGIRGVVLSLKSIGNVLVDTENGIITAQAGATNGKVARAAREVSLTGAEFLCGIPGGIGGALKMNAGAYGNETVDILKDITVMSPEGEIFTKTPSEIGFSYRHSGLEAGWIYLGCTFKLQTGEKGEIRDKMRTINKNRATSQPLNMPSSGSWFKNPIVNGEKVNAWKVVSDAGCRGMTLGGAQVSEKHTNFFVNTGGATSAEMLELTAQVEATIKEKLSIDMVREVRTMGDA
jgi:UDP-N-acetylmuramate dehydrogenase